MKKITAEEVREIQLNLLVEFARFCEKNHLYYGLAYGTLIGAVRHKGFIPWDDDIDVVMPRPDYEQFVELTKTKKIMPHMDVLSYKHGNSTYPFIKVTDTRTVVEEKFVSNTRIGVWIDVFPVDGNFENNILNAIHYKTSKVIRKLIEIKRSDFGSGTTRKKRILKGFIFPFTKLLPYGGLLKVIDWVSQWKKFGRSRLVGSIVWISGVYEGVDREAFLKAVQVEFEGYTFHAPSNYDECLRNVYGNYMQLPPEDKRIPHAFKAWWAE